MLLLVDKNSDQNDEDNDEHPQQQQQQKHQQQQCYQLHIIPHAFVDKVLYEEYTESSDRGAAVNIINPYRTKRAIGILLLME